MRLNETFRVARKAARVSQRLVADHVGVSRPTVSAIERKGREPRVGELARAASLFRLSPEMLMAGGFGQTVALSVEASFRKESDGSLDPHAKWELQHCQPREGGTRLQGRGDARGLLMPKLAEKVRSLLAIDTAPPVDVFRALISSPVDLEFTALTGVAGALLWAEDGTSCAIVVNSDQPDDRQRWTAVHEFAHFACGHHGQDSAHVDLFGPARLRVDQEADLVAAEVLMPFEAMRSVIEKRSESAFTPELLYRLADMFRVSYTAMIVRCSALGFISSADVTELRRVKPTALEKKLGLKAQRTELFEPAARLPKLTDRLEADGVLSPGWEHDFGAAGPMHLRRLQAEALTDYILTTPIDRRGSSATELFEEVASWIGTKYPWNRDA
jgi:Zn-dependent peptidase ImmA (M78 family)/transcriptional regulator with XRE-family HTH domain